MDTKTMQAAESYKAIRTAIPTRFYPKLSLKQLARRREQWLKAPMKPSHEVDRLNALEAVDDIVRSRQDASKAFRCALPKKQQRKLGLLPQLCS